MLKGHEIEDSARPNTDSTETASVGDLSSKSPASASAFVHQESGNQRGNDAVGALAAAEHLWRSLVGYVAARRSMRLYVTETRKYDNVARLTSKRLPNQPAAVPIYNSRWRTCMLVLDFDPTPRDASPQAEAQALVDVEHDAAQAIAWIHECGGATVVDRSSRGGVHVLVPFAHGEEFRWDHLMPVLTLLASKLPTLDILPMRNPEKGCITPPGARCKTGGFRRLTGMTVEQAITAFTTRSAPRLVANLVALLDPQRSLLTTTTVDPQATSHADGPHDDLALPPSLTTTAPLRPWVHPFLATGTVPELASSDGRPWTPSHARLSVLEQHAARGWSLAQIRNTQADPSWQGFWAGYAARRDADKRLKIDWSRAYGRAEKRLTRNAEKSSQPSHKPDQLHTGGDGALRDIRWKLAAARKWILISGHFSGRELLTALAVVNALAYGMSLGDGQSVSYGGRWVSVAAGLVGEPATRRVLRKLESLDGSPVRFLARWNAQEHTGDRYTLAAPWLDGSAVTAAEWEAYAARIEPVDPVWSLLGLGPWWVFEITRAIEPGPGETITPTELAAAARVSLSTVHRALRTLAEHGLVDHGHGWVARTGRSPRRLDAAITTEADDRYSARVARHQEERRIFWEFIDIITSAFTPRELLGYASIDELVRDTPAYNAAVDAEHSPPGYIRPPDREDSAAVAIAADPDTEALDLLQRELGAVLLT